MISFKLFYTITVRSNQHGAPWDIFFVVLGKSGCDVEKAIFNFILQIAFFRSFYFFFVMPCDDCPGTLLMISQQCFRIWFVAVRQQAFTWANTDPNLCHHMTSVSHELNWWFWKYDCQMHSFILSVFTLPTNTTGVYICSG